MLILRYPGGLKKAVTLSYDDGVEQDARLMDILDRHGLKATFNLNSGCWTEEGHVFPEGFVQRRLTLKAAQALYTHSGHEVASHTLTHPYLTQLPPAIAGAEMARPIHSMLMRMAGNRCTSRSERHAPNAMPMNEPT